MSQQAMTEFFSALHDDPALAERVRNAVEQNEGQAAIEAVAGVAADAGFDVGVADVADFRSRALELIEDSELSEERLEEVAGGLIGVDDVLLVGGGAVMLGGLTALVGSAVAVGSLGTVTAGMMISTDLANKVTDFFSKW